MRESGDQLDRYIIRENKDLVLFEDGVVVNKATMDARIKSKKYGEGIPYEDILSVEFTDCLAS